MFTQSRSRRAVWAGYSRSQAKKLSLGKIYIRLAGTRQLHNAIKIHSPSASAVDSCALSRISAWVPSPTPDANNNGPASLREENTGQKKNRLRTLPMVMFLQ